VLTERFSGQRVELGGYTTGSLIAEARIGPRTTGYARIDNLLDRRILTAYDRPSTRRALTIGLAWRGERFAADR
jgi:outer membrane cobalamin receptor